MERLRLERFSYRFAEQVLNSTLAIKQEIESLLTSDTIWRAVVSSTDNQAARKNAR
jgi:hypothetical protein